MTVNNIIIIDRATFKLAEGALGGEPQRLRLSDGVYTQEIMLCRRSRGFDLERVWIADDEKAFKSPKIINDYIKSKPYKITEINIHTFVIESCEGIYANVINSLLDNNEEVLRIEILSYGGVKKAFPHRENKVITALPRPIHEDYMRHTTWQKCTAEHENTNNVTSMTAKEHAVCKDFDMREFFKLLIGLHIELLPYCVICDSNTKNHPSQEHTDIVVDKETLTLTKLVSYKNESITRYHSRLKSSSYYKIIKQLHEWRKCIDNISASDFCKKYEEFVKTSCELMKRSETNKNE